MKEQDIPGIYGELEELADAGYRISMLDDSGRHLLILPPLGKDPMPGELGGLR
jgi:hypothetical protein